MKTLSHTASNKDERQDPTDIVDKEAMGPIDGSTVITITNSKSVDQSTSTSPAAVDIESQIAQTKICKKGEDFPNVIATDLAPIPIAIETNFNVDVSSENTNDKELGV
jgi:hypothetical protein